MVKVSYKTHWPWVPRIALGNFSRDSSWRKSNSCLSWNGLSKNTIHCLSLSQYQYLTYYLSVVIQLSYVFYVINYSFYAYLLFLIVDLVVLCGL